MRLRLFCVCLVASLPAMGAAQADNDPFELSFEELMRLEVVSVSKRAESQFTVPAAVHVVTSEHIARIGATSLGEALRGVPGLHVARINNRAWAITSRGFNGTFANKLLVLVDGRAVYDPTFAGVFWNNQEFVMSEIERIEVIRGPGAALWGANAVNGVINIITRHTTDTIGGQVTSTLGDRWKVLGAQYGGRAGDSTTHRTTAKYAHLDGYEPIGLSRSDGDARNLQLGFRLDHEFAASDSLLVEARALNRSLERFEQLEPTVANPMPGIVTGDEDSEEYSLTLRWQRQDGERGSREVHMQTTYFDRDAEDRLSSNFTTSVLNYQQALNWADNQSLVWGAGYRHVSYDTSGPPNASVQPAAGSYNELSVFLQNESRLIDDRLAVSYGLRLEDYERGGLEPQANIRFSWQPVATRVIWGALSRSVRTPSIYDTGIYVTGVPADTSQFPPLPVPVVGAVEGDGGLDAETLDAFDLGFRWHVSERLTLDVAGFAYRYDDVLSVELADLRCTSGDSFLINPACVATSPNLAAVTRINNAAKGNSHGAELSVSWQASDDLWLSFSHTFIELNLDGPDDASQFAADVTSGSTPEHQTSLSWRYQPWSGWSFDGMVRYVDNLSSPHVPGFTSFDIRVAWRPRQDIEVAVIGRDLGRTHLEFVEPYGGDLPTEIERSLLLQIALTF